MKQGWNGSNRYDRFCHRRFYSLWLGHGGYWLTFILDKKMNAYDLAAWVDQFIEINGENTPIMQVIAKKLRYQHDQIADLQTTVKFLEEECKALRKQLISATNAVMELRN